MPSGRVAALCRALLPHLSSATPNNFDLAACRGDRRDQQRIAAQELGFVAARERVGGKRQRHRAHDRQSRFDSLRDDRAQIRQQPIAEFDPASGHGFRFVAECPRFSRADAVHPHVRAEYGRLQPADVKLGRRLRRPIESADIGRVVRRAAHSPGERAAYARG